MTRPVLAGRLVLATLFSMTLVACGSKSKDSGTTAAAGPTSCTRITGDIPGCIEYVGSSYNGATAQGSNKKICEDDSGTFAVAACSTDNLVGSCRFNAGEDDEIFERYYSTNAVANNAEAAQARCAATKIGGASGTFVPN